MCCTHTDTHRIVLSQWLLCERELTHALKHHSNFTWFEGRSEIGRGKDTGLWSWGLAVVGAAVGSRRRGRCAMRGWRGGTRAGVLPQGCNHGETVGLGTRSEGARSAVSGWWGNAAEWRYGEGFNRTGRWHLGQEEGWRKNDLKEQSNHLPCPFVWSISILLWNKQHLENLQRHPHICIWALAILYCNWNIFHRNVTFPNITVFHTEVIFTRQSFYSTSLRLSG